MDPELMARHVAETMVTEVLVHLSRRLATQWVTTAPDGLELLRKLMRELLEELPIGRPDSAVPAEIVDKAREIALLKINDALTAMIAELETTHKLR